MIIINERTTLIKVFDELDNGTYIMNVSKETFHNIGEIEIIVNNNNINIIGVSLNDDFNDDFDIYEEGEPSNIDSLLELLDYKYGEYIFEINNQEYLVKLTC